MSDFTPIRSTFVTVLAWIFIVLAGFSTMGAVLQNIVILFVFPLGQIRDSARTADPNASQFVQFMVTHFYLFFVFFLAVSAFTLAAAIGLLKRMNWARLTFVGLMALGILWNVGGTIAMYFIMSSMATEARVRASPDFVVFSRVVFGFNLVVVIAFSVLFGWIIKRLTSADIRREFGEAGP